MRIDVIKTKTLYQGKGCWTESQTLFHRQTCAYIYNTKCFALHHVPRPSVFHCVPRPLVLYRTKIFGFTLCTKIFGFALCTKIFGFALCTKIFCFALCIKIFGFALCTKMFCFAMCTETSVLQCGPQDLRFCAVCQDLLCNV